MMDKVDIDLEQPEFERLMREKSPSMQFRKESDGHYANRYPAMAWFGWVLAKAHSKVKGE